MSNNPLQLGVVLDQLRAEQAQIHDGDDEVVQALHVLNVTTAVALGIQVGQDALRQILNPGLGGPLGERKRSV